MTNSVKPKQQPLLFRPFEHPRAGIPLGARSVGQRQAALGSREEMRPRAMCQVFWMVSGMAIFTLKDKEYEVSAGQAVLYEPMTPHKWRIAEKNTSWRYWTMDGPLLHEIILAAGLKEAVYRVEPCPHREFRQLREAMQDLRVRSERRASAIAYDLLMRLNGKAQKEKKSSLITSIRQQIDRDIGMSSLSIDQLAREAHVHRSQLSRQFTEEVGMSPKAYMTARRIQLAQTYLKESDRPIAQIAQQCGFDDPAYFARCFKKHSGVSPQQFRLGHE